MSNQAASRSTSFSAVTAIQTDEKNAESAGGADGDFTTNFYANFLSMQITDVPNHTRDFMAALNQKFRRFNMPQYRSDPKDLLRPQFRGVVTVTDLPRATDEADEER